MTGAIPQAVLVLVASILLLTILLGLFRIWRGPDLADRMLTAQLFGSTGVGLLLVLGELQQMPSLRNVALTLSLLAAMSTVAFVSRVGRTGSDDTRRPDAASAAIAPTDSSDPPSAPENGGDRE